MNDKETRDLELVELLSLNEERDSDGDACDEDYGDHKDEERRQGRVEQCCGRHDNRSW